MKLLFSPIGRITRKAFLGGWLALVGLLALFPLLLLGWAVVLNALSAGIPALNAVDKSWLDGPVVTVLTSMAKVVWFYMCACVVIKRLHDRGKSGWWSLAYLVPIVAIFIVPLTASGTKLLMALVFFSFLISFLFMVFDLVYLPSDSGPNEYGLPPMQY